MEDWEYSVSSVLAVSLLELLSTENLELFEEVVLQKVSVGLCRSDADAEGCG